MRCSLSTQNHMDVLGVKSQRQPVHTPTIFFKLAGEFKSGWKFTLLSLFDPFNQLIIHFHCGTQLWSARCKMSPVVFLVFFLSRKKTHSLCFHHFFISRPPCCQFILREDPGNDISWCRLNDVDNHYAVFIYQLWQWFFIWWTFLTVLMKF